MTPIRRSVIICAARANGSWFNPSARSVFLGRFVGKWIARQFSDEKLPLIAALRSGLLAVERRDAIGIVRDWRHVGFPPTARSMDNTARPKTKAERDALFAKMFAGIQPAGSKPPSIAATLRPYRRQLIAKRREGFSLRQIAEQLKTGPLQCVVAPSTLNEIIAGPAAKRRAKMKKLAARRAANLAAAKVAGGGATGAPRIVV